jgi:hypothetical protein
MKVLDLIVIHTVRAYQRLKMKLHKLKEDIKL